MALDFRRFKMNGEIIEYRGNGTRYSIYEREDSYMLETVTYDEIREIMKRRYTNGTTVAELIAAIEELESGKAA